jgi:hypothetical protein
MLGDHLVDWAVVAGCFVSSFTAGVLLGEISEPVVWQADLLVQIAVVVHGGNQQSRLWVSVSINASVEVECE